MAETKKSKERRMKEGWFDNYVKGLVLDIGCGNDPLTNDCDKWDQQLGHGDATFMDGVPDGKYQTVYTSHIIEHLDDPITGIKNWWRILSKNGHLIIIAPHRDLYEKKRMLPSKWNGDHRTMWLPDKCDPPHTFSLKHVVQQALEGESYDVREHRVLNHNWQPTQGHAPYEHSSGEYSIETVIKKI